MLAAVATAAVPFTGAYANMTGSTTHPCVLVNPERVAQLKAMAADGTPNAFGFSTMEAWQKLKAKADGFVAAAPYHYSVHIAARGDQPTEDWEYTLSDATPPRHDRTPSYPPWTAMFQERADSISTRLKHLSLAFLVIGDRRYFERAKKIALHLCKWECWTDPSYTAGTIKACLDTGHAAQNVALFYDWGFDQLTQAEREEIRTALVEKGVEPILAEVDRYAADTNGYAVLTCGLGMAALAIRPEEPRAAEWLQTAIDKTRHSLDLHGADGGAFEGPGYGTYLLDSFATLLDALESAGVQHGLFDHPFLATMDRYCIGLLDPGTTTQPCFGDGSPTRGYPQMMSILAHRGSREAAWYLEQIDALDIDTVNDFLRFDAAKLKPKQPDWNPSEVFVDVGYASLRDGFNADAPFLALKCGPPTHNIGHNHYDHNAFVLAHRGEWIVPDRGYRSRTHPPSTKFQQGTAGHCSILVDVDDEYMTSTTVPHLGHEQVQKAGGEIVEFFRSSSLDVVKGRAGKVYNTDDRTLLDRFDRTIFYLKPDLCVIVDELASPEPHRFSFLLHADGQSALTPQGEAWLLQRQRAQIVAHVSSPAGLTQQIRHWPEAEHFGPFLQAETAATTATTITSVLVPQAHYNPNLMANAGFENGLQGWQLRSNDDLPNHSVDTDEKHSGKASGRIEKSGYFYTSPLQIPVGTRVVAKAVAKTKDTTDGGVRLGFHCYKGGKKFHNLSTETTRPTDWTELTIEGTVPEDTEWVKVSLNYRGNGVGWYDTLSIECDPPLAEQQAGPAPPVHVEALADGAEGVVVTLGDRCYVMLINGTEAAKQIAVGDETYQLDGRFASVERDAGGELVSLSLYDGRSLKRDGNVLVRSGKRGAVAARVEEGVLDVTVQHALAPHAALPDQADIEVAVRLVGESAILNGRPAQTGKRDGLLALTGRP